MLWRMPAGLHVRRIGVMSLQIDQASLRWARATLPSPKRSRFGFAQAGPVARHASASRKIAPLWRSLLRLQWRAPSHDESWCLHCQHAQRVAAQMVAESAKTPPDADSIDVFCKLREVAETGGNLRKPARHALPACRSARSVKIEMVEMGSANCANCANSPGAILCHPQRQPVFLT